MADKNTSKKQVELKKIKAIQLKTEGVLACGKYKAGVVYKVGQDDLTNEEANRLVSHKGFSEVKS